MTSKVLSHRGRVASLSRSRPADDPELLDERRNLAAAHIAQFVAKHLASAPPLTDAQRADLARMFAGGESSA